MLDPAHFPTSLRVRRHQQSQSGLHLTGVSLVNKAFVTASSVCISHVGSVHSIVMSEAAAPTYEAMPLWALGLSDIARAPCKGREARPYPSASLGWSVGGLS